jgi:hypothetical protein
LQLVLIMRFRGMIPGNGWVSFWEPTSRMLLSDPLGRVRAGRELVCGGLGGNAEADSLTEMTDRKAKARTGLAFVVSHPKYHEG